MNGVCLAIFMCSRNRSNTNGHLIDVYKDRIPRWKNDMYPSIIVDSCNETLGGPFTVPGMQTISFAGFTSVWCSWGCPTSRETVAMEFLDRELQSNCSFILKISGKYWTPHLLPQIHNMSNATELVVQKGMRSSEIFGMSRRMFSM